MNRYSLRTLLTCAAFFAGQEALLAQVVFQSVPVPTGPGVASSTENVDFADVDLDGDWDAAFADGGDTGWDQNRIWINAGAGIFSDETEARLPGQVDTSRDIEFADIDNDGDVDLHISNESQAVSTPCKFWINAGTASGFFVDETASRWVGLGAAGSSLPPSAVLPGGGFVSWCGDTDFADLDNDGDLDLVHSSYGGSYSGSAPTRLFLNDGDGYFAEFNPAGVQLTGPTMTNGLPAIWAEGVQASNTPDASGLQADIATSCADVDLFDVDGDFDIDLLLGAISESPRLFQNRTEENLGLLGFRDVTSASFPSPYVVNGGNYEQEMGDFDGDGDVDLYGVNWGGNAGLDRTYSNSGLGFFSIAQASVPTSGPDDEEADFLDYDNDGDLDVFVANFSGADRLVQNTGAGMFASTTGVGTTSGGPSKDADACDLDGDGDYDVLVAESMNSANKLLSNITQVPDTSAPYLPNVEDPGAQVASTQPIVVRAHVYDNAPYYVTWYNPTQVDMSVDGCDLGAIPARSSQGQVFRAEIPGNLVGNVTLQWQSQDEYGNTGLSADVSYAGTTTLPFTSKFGPSTNSAVTGVPPSLDVLSVPFAGSTLYLAARGAASTGYLLALYDSQIPGGLPLPGFLLANIAGVKLLTLAGALDANGCDAVGLELKSSLSPGVSFYGQVFTFDGSAGGDVLASSQGTTIVTQ